MRKSALGLHPSSESPKEFRRWKSVEKGHMGNAKYGFRGSGKYKGINVSLVEGQKFHGYDDEMELRIINSNAPWSESRLDIRGHKEIMDKWTPDEIKRTAKMHIGRRWGV